MLLVDALVLIFGSMAFLFIFWKRLKEDYLPTNIFSTGFTILIGIFLGALVSRFFLSQWWFWTSFTGGVLGFLISVFRLKLRLYEILEAGVFALLPWLSLLYLSDSISSNNFYSLMAFLLTMGLIALFVLIDSKYKSFTWYKSGRVGFTGLVILGVMFLIRAVVTIFSNDIYSFSGRNDAMFSACFAFLAFLLLFNLSRKT